LESQLYRDISLFSPGNQAKKFFSCRIKKRLEVFLPRPERATPQGVGTLRPEIRREAISPGGFDLS
jgi:hypothetical protein